MEVGKLYTSPGESTLNSSISHSGKLQKEKKLSEQPQTKCDKAFSAAESLLEEHDIKEKGLLLRENIATCLYQGLGKKGLSQMELEDSKLTSKIESIIPNLRWKKKIMREIRSNYTDEEVLSHIHNLDKRLKEQIGAINFRNMKGYPLKFYIVGSFAKGRLGKNSDLDLLLETDSKDLNKWVLEKYYEEGKKKNSATIFPLPRSPFSKTFILRMMGPKIELGDGVKFLEDKEFLLKEYTAILKKKGYEIKFKSDGSHEVKKLSQEIKREREMHPWVERFWDKNSKYIFRREVNPLKKTWMMLLTNLCGASLLAPGIGYLANKILEVTVPEHY